MTRLRSLARDPDALIASLGLVLLALGITLLASIAAALAVVGALLIAYALLPDRGPAE